MWTQDLTMKFSALLLCLFSLAAYTEVEARGARFSGSSFRSSSSYRSYRSSRSYRSYRGYRSSGSRYTKYAVAAAAGYTVYGMTRYNTRYYGTRYYRSDPNICSNLDRYVTYDNGTISRTQKLDYFVCPYENDDPENAIYCCGPELQQYCCSYWASGKKTGAIAGILIGVIIMAVVVVICCKKCRQRNDAPPPVVYHASTAKQAGPPLMSQNGVPDHYANAGGQPGGYYPNPGAAPGYPPNPGYPGAGGAAYPLPGVASYPPQPSAPYPPAAAPYPAADPNSIGFESVAPPTYESAAGYPSKS